MFEGKLRVFMFFFFNGYFTWGDELLQRHKQLVADLAGCTGAWWLCQKRKPIGTWSALGWAQWKGYGMCLLKHVETIEHLFYVMLCYHIWKVWVWTSMYQLFSCSPGHPSFDFYWCTNSKSETEPIGDCPTIGALQFRTDPGKKTTCLKAVIFYTMTIFLCWLVRSAHKLVLYIYT